LARLEVLIAVNRLTVGAGAAGWARRRPRSDDRCICRPGALFLADL